MSKLKEKDCVKINYNAFVKETGELFDTTSEEEAKKHNILQKDREYEPVKTIIGAGFMLSGVDESLKGKKVGDEYEIVIPPSKGFGEWKSDYTENIKYNNFKKKNINPRKGMVLNIGGRMGRVSFVSKGRFVKIDFNHPLAGKELLYQVEIMDKIKKEKEKLKTIINLLLGKEGVQVSIKKNKAVITTTEEIPNNLKKMVKSKVKETLKKEYTLTFKYKNED